MALPCWYRRRIRSPFVGGGAIVPPTCHPEQAKRAEGSVPLNRLVDPIRKRILRLAPHSAAVFPLAQDDRWWMGAGYNRNFSREPTVSDAR